MNPKMCSLFAWAGSVFIVILCGSFLLMGFLPPIPAFMGAEAAAEKFEDNRTAIRAGATAIMQSCTLMFLWVAAISVQIRRIGGEQARTLSYGQLLLGFAGNIVFLLMSFAWTIAAFRAERSAELVAMLNDIGWLIVVMPVMPLTLQAFVIALAILSDKRDEPLFPRWAAYLNFWVGILFLPGAVTTFFKTGPFAWHGLLVFWVPIVAFIGWVFTMAWLVSRAATRPSGD
ncbi:hypothetical protein So717_41790 [Roseobacter cerasinus]|uniref:DUF4386 domain-containing protein n=1 Tax=Roseobacter cerasinus TaxID=2602289 RepID=A0A640W1R2_9RHOB|nr:hypothetical protein [Roseobacter cerasinus]GFE52426.1 hypothetical protein So717_41790 [Roseobacter cerasinus]